LHHDRRDGRAEPRARARDAHPRGAPERPRMGRDQGGAAPERDLLRRPRGELGVRHRAARDGRRGPGLMRTEVGIVGAGPAGLTLAQLLAAEGIESVVLESRSRDYVEHRIRAGVLEQGTVDTLAGAGAGERLAREGIVHHGIGLQFDGERHRIPLSYLTGSASIVIY